MNGLTTVLTGAQQLEQREYPLPAAPTGGALVRMLRANVCGSEVHMYHGRHPVIRPGSVLGHEGIGVIEALGDGLSTDNAGRPLRVGDRVVASYFQTCRHCRACQLGHTNICENGDSEWARPADEAPHFFGTFGTHWVVTAHQNLYKVDDSVSSIAASSANCALSQVVYALDSVPLHSGDTVAILGAGGLGLCASAVAASTGARVVVADMAQDRLDKAKTFGAHLTVNTASAADADGRIEMLRAAAGGTVDTIIDLTGVPSAFNEAARTVRRGGRFISIGNVSPGRTIEFDPGLFTRSGVTIQGFLRYPPEYLGRAMDFITDNPHVPWSGLVDADYPLDKVQEAIQAAEARTVTRAGLLIAADA